MEHSTAHQCTTETLERLLSQPENQWFERKSGRIAPKDLAKPLVAFANAEGGMIAVGLHNGKVDSLSSEHTNEVRQAALDFTNPTVRTRVEEITTPQGTILLLHVSPGDFVHETQNGECYQRVGDESRRLTFTERRELEFDRGSFPFDGTQSPAQDVANKRIAQFRKSLGSSTDENALRARSLLTRDGSITVAAHLLFADNPQEAFPNAYVRVLKYGGTERRSGQHQTLLAGHDYRIGGPLPEQIENAAAIITDLIPVRQALTDGTTFGPQPLVPRAAWLEALVNAVTHRSYSMIGDHIRVEIFPNRLEITSPGRFPAGIDPANPLSIHRHARNPRIARALAEMGFTQELGEGIRRIFDEMRRLGLTDPLYEQSSGAVRITLNGSDALPTHLVDALPAGARDVLDTLRRANTALGTGEVADILGIARPTAGRHLKRLRDAGLIEWVGQSPRDPRASWHVL